MKKFHLFVWGITFSLSVVPVMTNSYGDIGADFEWCWIKGNNSVDILCRFLQWLIPLWIVLAYASYISIRVYLKRRSDTSLQNGGNLYVILEKTKYYPLVLIVAWFFPSLHVILDNILGPKAAGWTSGVLAVSAGLFGFMNALVYGSRSAVKERLFALFKLNNNDNKGNVSHIRADTSSTFPTVNRTSSIEIVSQKGTV